VNLLARRLVVVLGKGGTGRSTVASALALAAVARGRTARVVVLGSSGDAAPGVDVFRVTVASCLEAFGVRKLHLPGFATRVIRNRIVATLVDAIPGLADVLLLGRIENLISEPQPDDPAADLLILDAPATGHGWTLLQAPGTMTRMTRTGPFFELARNIEHFLRDPDRTALVVCTLPEQLPVRESLELTASLAEEGFRTAGIVVNRVAPPPLLSPPPQSAVRELLDTVPGGEALAALLDNATVRQARQDAALQALQAGLDEALPFAALPEVTGPAAASLAPHVAELL